MKITYHNNLDVIARFFDGRFERTYIHKNLNEIIILVQVYMVEHNFSTVDIIDAHTGELYVTIEKED